VYSKGEDDKNEHTIAFNMGDTAELEIISHPLLFDGHDFVDDESYISVQFADGSVAPFMNRDWFSVLGP